MYADLLNLMLNRRSIRKYTNEDISDDKLNKILQAGLLSPSSRNLFPVEFIVVKNINKVHREKFIQS